ncbi:MAG: OmpP1/FadL family transporter [bacterium]
MPYVVGSDLKPVFKKYMLIFISLILTRPIYFVYPAVNGIVHADYPDMDMTATPNPVGSGARALGIGGAFISVADDATAASWNPSALLRLKRPEFSIVGSYYSGRNNYQTGGMEGDIEDHPLDIVHLNYLSAVFPCMFLQRNIVFSINYQHLYEFSLENQTAWREQDSMALVDVSHNDYEYQRGSLYAISPALALQIVPSFSIGLTFNFWDHDILDTGWENLNIQDAQGIDLGSEKISHSEVYERYVFSGFNMNLGFLFTSGYHMLWGAERRFRIGGVVKTPFKADIQHEKRRIFHEQYPGNPNLNTHQESTVQEDLTLKMPLSYGLGISVDFSDSFSTSLDIYRTHWDQYTLVYPSGDEVSPINKEMKSEANIENTTQIRIGAEYLRFRANTVIPVRMGFFYDPEPARGNVDDFYGVSMGSGIKYKNFAFDVAYQHRFGEKKNVESMLGEEISSHVTQHYLYTSMIFYF